MKVSQALKIAVAESHLKETCVNPYDVHGDGSVYVRCNSRSAIKCPSCSAIHVGDWSAIARSGIFDQDQQPLTGYEYAFVTFTAPSFGRVHSAPHRVNDSKRRCGCGTHHDFGDPIAGAPLNPDTYDWHGLLEFNQHMPRLFSRTIDKWRRRWGTDVQYFAVTEAQRRGTMHKHMIVRYPTGLLSSPLELLKETADVYTTSYTGNIISWGEQMDARRIDVTGDPMDAAKTSRYLLKMTSYSLKDVDPIRGDVPDHIREMMEYARFEYRCSASCSVTSCRESIHDDLAGTGRVLSQSKGWSVTKLTRSRLRHERRVYMEALVREGLARPSAEEGMTQEQLDNSRFARRYRKQVEKKLQRERQQKWEQYQAELQQPDPYPLN